MRFRLGSTEEMPLVGEITHCRVDFSHVNVLSLLSDV